MVRVSPEQCPEIARERGRAVSGVRDEVRPAGVGSLTVTPCAAAGPALATVRRTNRLAWTRFGFAGLGNSQVRGRRSHGSRHVEALLPGSGSLAAVATVTVLTMELGPE